MINIAYPRSVLTLVQTLHRKPYHLKSLSWTRLRQCIERLAPQSRIFWLSYQGFIRNIPRPAHHNHHLSRNIHRHTRVPVSQLT